MYIIPDQKNKINLVLVFAQVYKNLILFPDKP